MRTNSGKIMAVVIMMVMAGLTGLQPTEAGSLDSPAGPGDPASAMFTLNDIYNKLDTRTNVTKRTGAFMEPSAGPTSATMHSLNDIMTLVTNSASVRKTGQTTSYLTNDDGWFSTNFGVAWPSARFTVQSNTNCVKDNLTKLIWARNANIPGGTMQWTNAVEYCATNLNLSGYGGCADWRLPNAQELNSLIDFSRYNPALPSGHPFNNVQNNYYWSGVAYVGNPDRAWCVSLSYGVMASNAKVTANYFWPVRGGGD